MSRFSERRGMYTEIKTYVLPKTTGVVRLKVPSVRAPLGVGLSVGLLGHHEGIDMNGPVKKMLDELHLRKIDLADEILVLDVPVDGVPYVGESTSREIAYAESLGKPVRYLSKESEGA